MKVLKIPDHRRKLFDRMLPKYGWLLYQNGLKEWKLINGCQSQMSIKPKRHNINCPLFI